MRKSSFFKRLKVGIVLIFKKKNARIMTCGKCGGTNIIPISNSLEQPFASDNIKADLMYLQFSKCNDCGAVCKELQLWSFEGKAEDLDPKIKPMEDSDVQD
jgi:hypothetical protein